MTRKSAFALAIAPIIAGVLMFSGCDSGSPSGQTDMNRNPRNELNKSSMDYMRQQYESKSKKKSKPAAESKPAEPKPEAAEPKK